MSRPRPRVEGKGNPAVTAKGAKSQAPKEARVVPKELTEGSEEAKKKLEAAYRARAAHGMLKSKNQWVWKKNNSTYLNPCTGADEFDGRENEPETDAD